MIAIIDYGVGNLRSVEKAFAYLGYPALVTSDPAIVREAEKVVLPGVGAFGKSMESLKRAGMIPVVKEVAASGRPFLGICLGLQMLFEESAEVFGEETAKTEGLGILPGQVLRLGSGRLKVPQIGWNQIRLTKKENPLFHGVDNGSFVYFVHSYYVSPTDAGLTACTTHYEIEYCSGISKGNIHAFQFHPEKSSRVGLKILKNFAELK
ncbi:MAG: imidazole glycerol phosphate synthase subunit HisH [Bacteroidota bacterium]